MSGALQKERDDIYEWFLEVVSGGQPRPRRWYSDVIIVTLAICCCSLFLCQHVANWAYGAVPPASRNGDDEVAFY